MVQVPFFNDEVRDALAGEGIIETFYRTNPERDSNEPTNLRLVVPGDTETLAGVCLIRALHHLPGGFERLSGWHQMPIDWDG